MDFYLIVGVIFSIFYGCNAIDIFVDKSDKQFITAKPNSEEIWVPSFYSQKKDLCSWKFHQFWLNFIGSASGWASLGYLIFFRFDCRSICKLIELNFTDFAFLLVGIIGITGFLPNTISKIQSLVK